MVRGRKFGRRWRLYFKGERRGGGAQRGGRRVEAERGRARGGLGTAETAQRRSVGRQQLGRGVRGRQRSVRDNEGRQGWGDADGVADRWIGTRRGPDRQRLGAS
jgi:hypothetical protein